MPDHNEEQLQALSVQILRMAQSAAAQPDLSNADLRRVLNFLVKLVQVVEQAFQGIYAILVDVKLLGDDEIGGGQVKSIRRDLEMVSSRSWYRDAEEICSRLHHLSENYRESIAPIVDSLARREEWNEIFRLIDEHEGHIIGIVQTSVAELKGLLANLQTTDELALARQIAEAKSTALQATLAELTDFRNRILGISGTGGFLELIETNRGAVAAQLQVFIDNADWRTTNIHTGGGAYVGGNVSVSDGDFVGNVQLNTGG